MADTIERTAQADRPATAGSVRMTEAMREGLDALQREYDAFVESSFKTLAFVSDHTPPTR